MRRKPGTILPLEATILAAGIELDAAGTTRFHGFLIAKQLRGSSDARKLTAHGTLYKALGRMETAGLLESEWEDPDVAVEEGRPRRRLYRVTASGRAALVRADQRSTATGLDPGWSPA